MTHASTAEAIARLQRTSPWGQSTMYLNQTVQCERLVPMLGLPSAAQEDVLTRMTNPNGVHILPVPVAGAGVALGARIQFDNTCGPYQGGMRLLRTKPDMTAAIAKFVGMGQGMMLKGALTRIQRGGGKGFLYVPENFSDDQVLEALYQFSYGMGDLIGFGVDGWGPDMNMVARYMLQMQRGHAARHPDAVHPICMTGLPVGDGGLEGREDSTGEAAMMIAERHLRQGKRAYGRPNIPFGPRVTIGCNGFGQVTQAAAMFAFRRGAPTLTLADDTTYLYNADGINVPEAIEYCRRHGSLHDYQRKNRAEVITARDHFGLPLTLMVVASVEGVLTPKLAAHMQAEELVEAGNRPQHDDVLQGLSVSEILAARNVGVLPYQLVSSGGVVGSDISLNQAAAGVYYTRSEVMSQLAVVVNGAYDRTVVTMDHYGVDMSDATVLAAATAVAETLGYMPR